MAAPSEVVDGGVPYVADGTMVAKTADSVVIRTDDHGHKITFAVDRSTVLPGDITVGSMSASSITRWARPSSRGDGRRRAAADGQSLNREIGSQGPVCPEDARPSLVTIAREPSVRSSPDGGSTLDATIGSPTNGKWPKNWIHQRIVIEGGRCTITGITTSDITIQTSGP